MDLAFVIDSGSENLRPVMSRQLLRTLFFPANVLEACCTSYESSMALADTRDYVLAAESNKELASQIAKTTATSTISPRRGATLAHQN